MQLTATSYNVVDSNTNPVDHLVRYLTGALRSPEVEQTYYEQHMTSTSGSAGQ